jgi:hypothetical protein
VIFEHLARGFRRHFWKLARQSPDYFEATLDVMEGRFCLADDQEPEENDRNWEACDEHFVFGRFRELF